MPVPDGFWDAGDEGTPDNMNQCLLQYDTAANLPAATANNKGMIYYETDTGLLKRSNGSTYDTIFPTTRSALLTGQRTAAAGSGVQNVTGAGFQPTGCIAFGVNNTNTHAVSIGVMEDGDTEDDVHYAVGAGTFGNGARLIFIDEGGGVSMDASSAFQSDGVDLTWTKTGAGVTVNFRILVWR